MNKIKFLALVMILFMSLPFIYGGCGSDDDDDDPCAGPVPCLTADSGTTFYEFIDEGGDPVLANSWGDVAGVVGIYYDAIGDPYPIALAGSVIDCYNSTLEAGAIDWNWNGIVDSGEEFASVSGNMNICNVTLTVSNLVLDGIAQQDTVATYVGTFTSSLSGTLQIDREPPIEILPEVMERMRVE